MPKEQPVKRLDKLAKLIAVFDEFHQALTSVDDPLAQRLMANWDRIRPQYIDPPTGVPRSALAGGMEQGLREMPLLIQSMSIDARKRAAQALASATQAHSSEFLAKDAERLANVKARGFIRGESEFYLIRHRVDVLEGMASETAERLQLYALLGAYEAK